MLPRKPIAAPEAFQTFGDLLVYLRKRARLTQEELGRAVGYSRPQITLLEKNQRWPSATTVMALFVPALDLDDAPELAQRLIELAAAARQPRTNLPAPVNALIGREDDAAQVRAYFAAPDKRLVTLIGPPGIGKTRLSLQVAADLLPEFADGVFFVPLAPIEDPNLVAPTILQTLGLAQTEQHSPLESLKEGIGSRHILVVLDNFEQIVEASPLVPELLMVCPRLRLIITSRESLRVPGEWLYPVPSLALPDEEQLQTLPIGAVDHFSALRLFVERARAVQPSFKLTPENTHAVVAICRQLDGLPLAIELIAARIRWMSSQALLSQLTGDFALQADGMRGVPARQKTLHNAIAWSYALLSAAEQMLLRRVAVFVNGWTLEAVEAVCAGDRIAIHEIKSVLHRLVDKSLVITDPQADELRFGMLETIRHYARARLVESRENDRVQSGHLSYYLRLAEEATSHLSEATQAIWISRLDREYPNLRAALAWAEASRQTEPGLRLAVALGYFWGIRLYMNEERLWLRRALAAHTPHDKNSTALHAKALLCLSEMERLQGDYAAARPLAEESRGLLQACGDQNGLAEVLRTMGGVALGERRYREAKALFEEGLAVQQELDSPRLDAWALNGLGEVARAQNDYASAESFYLKALDLFRATGDDFRTGNQLLNLGFVALQQGNDTQAQEWLQEALSVSQKGHDAVIAVGCLIGFAGVLSAAGDPARAVKILGVVDVVLTAHPGLLEPQDQIVYDRILTKLHTQLDKASFFAVWSEGQQMTIEQAIELAQSEKP
jgi:predicted ATPase